jgi:hypothetical protein
MFAPVSDTPKKNTPEQWVINGMPEGSVVFMSTMTIYSQAARNSFQGESTTENP